MKNYSIKLLEDGLEDIRATRGLILYHMPKKDFDTIRSIERSIEKDISLLKKRKLQECKKFNEVQIKHIKELYLLGWTQDKISTLLGVSIALINMVLNEKRSYAA